MSCGSATGGPPATIKFPPVGGLEKPQTRHRESGNCRTWRSYSRFRQRRNLKPVSAIFIRRIMYQKVT